MPTYHLKCQGCGDEWEHSQSIHVPLRRDHPETGEGRDGFCGPVVQVFEVPTIHGVGVSGVNRTKDRETEKDAAAYKRLRRNGLQPKSFRGAAALEARATERFEVERNMVIEDKKLRDEFKRVHDEPKPEPVTA